MGQIPDLLPLSETERESLVKSAWAEARAEAKDLKDHPLSLGLHTLASLKAHLRALARSSGWRAAKFSEIADQIAELKAELAQLREERGAMNLANAHRGTYQRGCQYQRGDLITSSGGIWLALSSTTDRPGNSDCWRLIAKP